MILSNMIMSFQVTSPWAYTFVALHYNMTNSTEDSTVISKYTTGWKDACAVFFYFLITIVLHAVLQEYIFDVRHLLIINYKCVFSFGELLLTKLLSSIENFQAASSQQGQTFQIQRVLPIDCLLYSVYIVGH